MKQAAEEVVKKQMNPVIESPDVVIQPKESSLSHRQQVYQQVKDYQAVGQSVRWVASELGLSRNTVRKYWRWTTYYQKVAHRWSPIFHHEEYLRKRWAEGQRHVKTLHQELQTLGYQGSFRTLYQVVSRFLNEEEPAPPAPRRVDYSARQVSCWLARSMDEMPTQSAKEYLEILLQVCPILKEVRDLALRFKALMQHRQVDQLDTWLLCCETSELAPLQHFARGLRQDHIAVRQAFCSEWSNGQVEGQVNRLKTIKRQMYGRASFELLRRRVVMTSG